MAGKDTVNSLRPYQEQTLLLSYVLLVSFWSMKMETLDNVIPAFSLFSRLCQLPPSLVLKISGSLPILPRTTNTVKGRPYV